MKDSQNMLGSIKMIPQQIREAWEQVSQIVIPTNYNEIKNIVVSGMGGSALGAWVIKSQFGDKLSVPLEIVNEYHLPAYINENTLVILSSYSGSTEETLSCASECLEKKAKVLGITTGGQLEVFLMKYNFPMYKIKPVSNPCNQPRMALGYSIFGQIALLNKIGLIHMSFSEIEQSLSSINLDSIEKAAQTLSPQLKNKQIIVIASEHLSANAHICANQLNENAKNFAFYFLLSELNHHLMEGLQFPKKNPENLIFLLLMSKKYSERMLKRLKITHDVIFKHNVPIVEYTTTLSEISKLAEGVETLIFSSFISFYLSQENGIDPSPIPWVDYFKDKLGE